MRLSFTFTDSNVALPLTFEYFCFSSGNSCTCPWPKQGSAQSNAKEVILLTHCGQQSLTSPVPQRKLGHIFPGMDLGSKWFYPICASESAVQEGSPPATACLKWALDNKLIQLKYILYCASQIIYTGLFVDE